ncbi:MAG: hypothetical protein NT015_05125 [Alphaproteobacteria bacterium]|nr:hypothetical protein [Alphaproteobacteria bacterium]
MGRLAVRLAALALAALTSAYAQAHAADPGPPSACITAVYDSMTGTWGRDDMSFMPNNIPVSAWNIIPQDGDVVAMLTMGETNVWFLTEHGADRMHDLRNGQYDGVLAFRLLSCQEGGNGRPGVIESTVSGERLGSRVRERLEVHADYFTIQHFDRRDRLLDEQRMRRYTAIAVDPPPAPPGFAVNPPPAPPSGVAVDPPPPPPR